MFKNSAVAVRYVFALGAAAMLSAACGSTEEAALVETKTVTVEATAAQAVVPTLAPVAQVPAPAAVVTQPAAPPVPAEPALMPSVVCANLQSAQNAIQEAGVFFSRSADASGQGRAQINDSNWIVVEQQPAPGSMFGEGDAVLSVVKIGEPNNC